MTRWDEHFFRHEYGRLVAVLSGRVGVHHIEAVEDAVALLALMHLHVARVDARQDESGGLLLLEEQDRVRWDREEIQIGLQWLGQSAQGDRFSRYHAEAGIAAEHCLAPSFQQTRWDRVAENYALLERLAPSAIHRLNRAVALRSGRGRPRAWPFSRASSRPRGLPCAIAMSRAEQHPRRPWRRFYGDGSRPAKTTGPHDSVEGGSTASQNDA